MRESLLRITQPEAEAILKRSGLAIIPMGSVEQHGPHLPLGTDLLYAEHVCGRHTSASHPCAFALPLGEDISVLWT